MVPAEMEKRSVWARFVSAIFTSAQIQIMVVPPNAKQFDLKEML
jgi:hypothetical protein